MRGEKTGAAEYCSAMQTGDSREQTGGGSWQRETLIQLRKFTVQRVTRTDADGAKRSRDVLRHPGAVVIVPILEASVKGREAEIVLIHNERISLETRILELPAGTREAKEPPEVTAARELIEETGYEAATVEPLGRFYTTPGLTDELMYAYVARGLRHVGQKLEADEAMTVVVHPVSAVLRMIDTGELADAKSMLAILLAVRRGMVGV